MVVASTIAKRKMKTIEFYVVEYFLVLRIIKNQTSIHMSAACGSLYSGASKVNKDVHKLTISDNRYILTKN